MKIKIFKKIIAVLCAAAMSTSIVVPTGAINYASNNVATDQENALKDLNGAIEQSQKTLQEIKQYYLDIKKDEYANLISSVMDNLKKLDNSNVSNELFLTGILLTRVKDALPDSINFMKRCMNYQSDDGDDYVKEYAIQINSNIETLLKLNDEKEVLGQLMRNVASKNTEMIKLIESIKKQNPSFKGNVYTEAANDCLEQIKKEDIRIIEKYLNQAIHCLDDTIEYLKKLNDKLQNRPSKDSKIELNNKKKEFDQKLKDTEVIANHNLIDTTPISTIEKKFKEDWCKLINVQFTEKNFKEDWDESDLSKLSKEDIQKRIVLINDTIKSLKKFALKINFIVIPNELSNLKTEFGKKRREFERLYEHAKPNLDTVIPEVKEDLECIKKIDMTDTESIREAISKVKDAIISLEKYDTKKPSHFQKWQKDAHKDIDKLLNEATEEMKINKYDTTIENLKKEFQPFLCGRQTFRNCWLYAIRNVMNILNHLKNKDKDKDKNKDIVQNSQFLSLLTKYNNVEQFFIKNADISKKDVVKGGTDDDESKVLSKLGIKHIAVNLDIENTDETSLEKNMNIVKTLLLKHFAHSEAPVLISVRYDLTPLNCRSRKGGFHAMTIVGVDINTDSVVVADSNRKELQVYSLDRIALEICNHGVVNANEETINMIFPLITNEDGFTYDNNKMLFSNFERELLSAISK